MHYVLCISLRVMTVSYYENPAVLDATQDESRYDKQTQIQESVTWSTQLEIYLFIKCLALAIGMEYLFHWTKVLLFAKQRGFKSMVMARN